MIPGCRGVMLTLLVVSAVSSTAGCSDSSKADDRRPLPTVAPAGELLCGFVSRESLAIVLGTSDLRGAGSKQDTGGVSGKNPDGSTLSAADCRISPAKSGDAGDVKVSVEQLGVDPVDDATVPNAIASGRAQYVFPAVEGLGFAASDKSLTAGDGVADLIVGDWNYTVTIEKSLTGRNAVDDAVAITRQVVATLNLPKVGKLPRPTATPSK